MKELFYVQQYWRSQQHDQHPGAQLGGDPVITIPAGLKPSPELREWMRLFNRLTPAAQQRVARAITRTAVAQ